MKILIPLLAFLFVLSGCSEWKYSRGVRSSKNEVRYSEVIIEKNKVEPLVIAIPSTSSNDLSLSEKKVVEPKVIESKITVDKKELQEIKRIPTPDQVVENLDSLKRQDEIVREARQAEQSGRSSVILGVLGTFLALSPLFIAGLVLGISGLRRSSAALNAAYITPKGLNLARVGNIFSIVAIVISSVLLFFLLLLILLLVFSL